MVLGALPSACSTSQSLSAAGQTCLNATDCQPGLVCLPSGNGSERVCSDDLSGVQTTETTDAGMAAAKEGGTKEGGTATEGGTTDSGGGTDSGSNPTDSGTGG
jgi:hypothetical protein